MKGYIIEYVTLEEVGGFTIHKTRRGIFKCKGFPTQLKLASIGAVSHSVLGEVNTTVFTLDMDEKETPSKVNKVKVKYKKPGWYMDVLINLGLSNAQEQTKLDVATVMEKILTTYYAVSGGAVKNHNDVNTYLKEIHAILDDVTFLGKKNLLRTIAKIPKVF
jgi:hypothetical protein